MKQHSAAMYGGAVGHGHWGGALGVRVCVA